MDISVHLGGQSMCFLGSVDCITEGSGLSEALEPRYAPLTVVHMLTWKHYGRALRGAMLLAASLLSLVFEEVSFDASPEEQSQLISIFESSSPFLRQNDDVSLKLSQWLLEWKGRINIKITHMKTLAKLYTAESKNDWFSNGQPVSCNRE